MEGPPQSSSLPFRWKPVNYLPLTKPLSSPSLCPLLLYQLTGSNSLTCPAHTRHYCLDSQAHCSIIRDRKVPSFEAPPIFSRGVRSGPRIDRHPRHKSSDTLPCLDQIGLSGALSNYILPLSTHCCPHIPPSSPRPPLTAQARLARITFVLHK